MEPMIGLLAVAALDGLDDAVWAALQTLAAHPGGAASWTAPSPDSWRRTTRCRPTCGCACWTPWTCSASRSAVAAVRRGRTAAQVRALLRRMSGVDAVVDQDRGRRRRGALPAGAGRRRGIGGAGRLGEWRADQRVPVPRRHGGRADGRRRRPGRGRRAGPPDCESAWATTRPRTCRGRCAGSATAAGRSAICTAPAARTSPGDRCGCGRSLRVAAASRTGVAVSDEVHDDPVDAGGRAGGGDRAASWIRPPSTAATWCW